MGTLFLISILAGAVLALFAAIGALRAYLRLRRARAALQSTLTEEVDRLSRRTRELEKNLSTLDARAQQLPIQIAELQQSLSTLRVLTAAPAATPTCSGTVRRTIQARAEGVGRAARPYTPPDGQRTDAATRNRGGA